MNVAKRTEMIRVLDKELAGLRADLIRYLDPWVEKCLDPEDPTNEIMGRVMIRPDQVLKGDLNLSYHEVEILPKIRPEPHDEDVT